MDKEDVAFLSDELSNLINQAIKDKDAGLINFIRSLWDDESWKSIQEKFNTEGSVWVVWWYDGLRKLNKIQTDMDLDSQDEMLKE